MRLDSLPRTVHCFSQTIRLRRATLCWLRGLKAAGAIVVGKTNTPELGHKADTDNAISGPPRILGTSITARVVRQEGRPRR